MTLPVEDRLDDGGAPPRPVTPTPYVPAPAASRAVPLWLYAAGIAALWLATVGGLVYWLRPSGPTPPPSPVADYDPAFVPIGQQVGRRLGGPDFAQSYEDGTKLIEAGQGADPAGETASDAYSKARIKTMTEVAVPALEKVVPFAKAKKNEMTPDERKALVRARRGISKGAEGR